ncbi:MAG TPA: PH domain-containing protein [Pirellulales bacterium]|nr:PH domain-containing protein [Pirellulales bacterium]
MISASKRDWWARYLVVPAALALIAGGAWLVWSSFEVSILPGDMLVVQLHRSYFMSLLGLLMPIFGVTLLWMLTTTEYEITAERLVLRSGPSRTCIPLGSIDRAFAVDRPWRGGLARGPAWSFDMLRVDYRLPNGKRASPIVFSPRDKDEFLRRLTQSLPQGETSEETVAESPVEAAQ